MSKQLVRTIENILVNMEKGDIGFAEAGDWLHGNGDEIVSRIEELEGDVEDLEIERNNLMDEKEQAYDEGYNEGYNEGFDDGISEGEEA